MEDNIIFGLALNTSLLLALVVLYETIPLHKTIRSRVMEVFTGVLVGSIGIMVMLTPWHFSEGVVFDTRSILISMTGLFFGGIPTFITVLMTASLRIYQGGAGAVMGVSVIVTSASLGLLWRYFLKFKKKTPVWYEFYGFGIVVHLAMLGCTSFLPREIGFNVLKTIALPVMLIYPVGTVLLGLTLLRRDQRIRLEQEVRASNKRFKALFEQSPYGVLIIDPITARFKEFNTTAHTQLGYSREEFARISILDVEAQETADETHARIQDVIQNGKADFETLQRTRQGEIRNVHVIAQLVDIEEHQLYYCIWRDITEHKRAEAALLASEARLLASEARLLAAERIAKLGNWEHDALTGKLIWSDEIFNIFEIDPKQFGATYESFLNSIHPQDREMVNEAYTSSLKKHQPYNVTHRLLMPDGRIKYVLERCETFYDETGKPLRSIGTVQDVTERKQAEDEIRQLNASLEQRVEERTIQLREAQEQLVRQEKLAILGQLAGGVGHELRNPLGVISNAIYFLKMTQSGADEKVKEYLDLIDQQVNISNKIITDLLDFTRANIAERAPVSVVDVIQRMLKRYPAPEHIRVEVELPADLPNLYVDSQQVIQALGNLAVNAYQSMSLDSAAAKENRCTISASARGSAVCIAIQDTGCGISPEDLKKIFEPLFTTKLKGIGLGLAVTKKLLEVNGGSIEVQSEVGKGSTFRVCLPVYEETK